jgi:hypothetical protein
MARFWNGLAVIVLAGGLAAASGMPASAAPSPAARPTVTIAAKSQFKPVTGDVFVVFNTNKQAKAQIQGKISGASRGDVARLFAQSFPFSSAPRSVASTTDLTKPYSFTVSPSIATRYRVELFASSKSTTPLAESAVRTVYVSNLQELLAISLCSRPVCSEVIRVKEFVPASALKDEMAKHWYFYFGLNLSSRTTPPQPKVLTLDTHAKVSGATRTNSTSFTRSISWSFRINNDGYNFLFSLCTKDTEAKDGLGLPGHHGCGDSRVSATVEYLG